MSWSFNAIGTPEKVKAHLERSVAGYAPAAGAEPSQSYLEFKAAQPHLAGLLDLVYERREGQPQPVVQVEACGSGSSTRAPGERESVTVESSVSVNLRKLYAPLV